MTKCAREFSIHVRSDILNFARDGLFYSISRQPYTNSLVNFLERDKVLSTVIIPFIAMSTRSIDRQETSIFARELAGSLKRPWFLENIEIEVTAATLR